MAAVQPPHFERCLTGRLARAYPAAAHDVEIRATAPTSTALRAWTEEAFAADPQCRRVIHAIAAGDTEAAEIVHEAGFRHVVDVDLADEELELWVAEPAWVTMTDMDLDQVPHQATFMRPSTTA